MGIDYGRAAQAEVSQGGSYFKEGTYKVRINRCLEKVSNKTRSDLAIIEAEVVESTNVAVPVGSVRSQVIDFSKPSAEGNLKGFCQAAVESMHKQGILDGNAPDEEVDGETMQAIMQNDIAVGTLMNLECVNITTKAGNPFTKHNWSPANG